MYNYMTELFNSLNHVYGIFGKLFDIFKLKFN